MKKLTLGYISTIALVATVFSCAKESLGPNITDVYAPVKFVEAFNKSAATVNCTNGESVYFTAIFEKETDWTITLTGANSSAVRTFEGVSKTLDKSNSLWNGTANTIPSFQVELVKVMLTFKHTNDTFKTTLNLTGTRNLDKIENGVVLITNFTVLKQIVCNAYNGATCNNDWQQSLNSNLLYPKADGSAYLYMEGVPQPDWQTGTYSSYVNFYSITAHTSDVNYGPYFPLPADSNKVYFNIMVYGTNAPDSRLTIQLSEDGVAQKSVDIIPNWKGWKLLSYRYSEMHSLTSKTGHSDKINKIQFTLNSDHITPKSSGIVKFAIDHPTFTLNHPYQP